MHSLFVMSVFKILPTKLLAYSLLDGEPKSTAAMCLKFLLVQNGSTFSPLMATDMMTMAPKLLQVGCSIFSSGQISLRISLRISFFQVQQFLFCAFCGFVWGRYLVVPASASYCLPLHPSPHCPGTSCWSLAIHTFAYYKKCTPNIVSA